MLYIEMGTEIFVYLSVLLFPRQIQKKKQNVYRLVGNVNLTVRQDKWRIQIEICYETGKSGNREC